MTEEQKKKKAKEKEKIKQNALKKKVKISSKVKSYCDGVLNGLSKLEAYKQSDFNSEGLSPPEISSRYWKIENRPNVIEYYAEQRKKMEDKIMWDRNKSIKALIKIINDCETYKLENGKYKSTTVNVALKTIGELNKMLGYNEPEKINISGDGAMPTIILTRGEIKDDEVE